MNRFLNNRQYEEQLSPFGKKVLKELMKKCNRDSIRQHAPPRDRQIPTPATQNPKVLHFLNEDTLPIPNILQINSSILEINSIEKNNEPIPNNNSFHNELPAIPNTSNDILSSVHTNNGVNHVTTLDLLKPVDDGVQSQRENIILNDDFSVQLRTENLLNDIHEIRNDIIKIPTILQETSKTNINWEDMIDSELCEPSTNAASHCNFISRSNDYEKFDNIVKSKEISKDAKEDNCRPKKRKRQPKITDKVVKKVKKHTENMPSLRKQKYKKVVRNWLVDVDPNNLVDEVNMVNGAEQDTTLHIKELNMENTKNNKKVIQAQLVNKGGIMKYTKPKNITEPTKQVEHSALDEPANAKTVEKSTVAVKLTKIQEETAVKEKSANTKVTKEKKGKTKFTAPIKSQTPVQDITYDVVVVTDVEQCVGLNDVRDKDIAAVLIYSNGFSQLNKHHTEDSCLAEGIIIQDKQQFYYFKNIDENYTETIRSIFENNKIICYDGKYVLIYLKSAYKLYFTDLRITDVKIGGAILEPDASIDNFSELQKLLSYTVQFTIATTCPLQKAAWYITLLRECASLMHDLLQHKELLSLFHDIEMKLLPIIADMEYHGVQVDVQKLKLMEDILLAKMKQVEQQCYAAAGKVFQINSTLQVRAIIYDELALDTKCNVKIRETISKGAKSTSEAMLRSLIAVHPLPKLILEYRRLHKAHATFVVGIMHHVTDGVVKPTWVQTAAATGRIACNNPNLQAIPKAPFHLNMLPEGDDDVDDKVGAAAGTGIMFRGVYVCGRGRVLLAADFRHVECRVLAHLAQDTTLQTLLRGPHDLFRALAAEWLKKPIDEVTGCDRERSKRLVYAIMYGAGPRKIMEILELSYEQTLAVIASFNGTFPLVKSFGTRVVSAWRGAGASLRGRRRALAQLRSNDAAQRAHAQRQALNFVIQGSAADLCKLAMVSCCARVHAAHARLLLQIHDELVFDVREQHLHAVAGVIKESMESCGRECGMCVPLPVVISVGHNWADMKEYNIT